MATEWDDDAGESWWQRVRCVEPPTPPHAEGSREEGSVGCGWSGEVRAVMLFGAMTYKMDDCPECGGAIEDVDE